MLLGNNLIDSYMHLWFLMMPHGVTQEGLVGR